MVPKQDTINRIVEKSDTVTERELPIFGSQLVDPNSLTPYSDATQVRVISLLINNPKPKYFFFT